MRTFLTLLALGFAAAGCAQPPACPCPETAGSAGGEHPVDDELEPVPEEPGTGAQGLALVQSDAATALSTELTGRARFHFIDVGQGDATLLEFSCAAVLVDTGGETPSQFPATDRLIEYLDAFFARRPDLNNTLALLVLTHPHIDHTRGVREVTNRFTVQNVVTNGMESGSGGAQQRRLHADATAGAMGLRRVQLGEIPAGGLTDDVIDPVACADVDPELRVFWGAVESDPGWEAGEFDDANNHSVVLRVRFGPFSALFTGDLEEPAQEELVARNREHLDVDLYQVGHHGSRNGSGQVLLDAMSPLAAVVSMGPPQRRGQHSANSYGHPNLDVVERLERATSRRRSQPINVLVGTRGRRHNDPDLANFVERTVRRAVYATGWDGTVVVTVQDDGRFWVRRGNNEATSGEAIARALACAGGNVNGD